MKKEHDEKLRIHEEKVIELKRRQAINTEIKRQRKAFGLDDGKGDIENQRDLSPSKRTKEINID